MDNKKIIRVCKHCNEVKKIEEFELNNIKNGPDCPLDLVP